MSIRELPSGRFVVELAGYYLGNYPDRAAAEAAEDKLQETFEPVKRGLMVEQEAVEHALAASLFRCNAEKLSKLSAELGRYIQELDK